MERQQSLFSAFTRTLAATLALWISAGGIAWAQWPTGGGSSLADQAIDVKVGPSGDIYVVGNFQGLTDFGGEILTSENSLDDVIVAKISQGGTLQWAQAAGGSSAVRARALAIDGAENVYLVGEFFGDALIGGTLLRSGTGGTGDPNTRDGFVAKLDSSGQFEWARAFGGDLDDSISSVGVVPGTNSTIPPVPDAVIVAGSYVCSASYTGGTISSTNACFTAEDQFENMFVAHLSPTGTWETVVDRGGASSNLERINHMSVAGDGRAFIAGRYAGPGDTITATETFASIGGVPSGWTTTNGTRSGVGDAFGRRMLFLRHGRVDVQSPVYNLQGLEFASLDFLAQRGSDSAGSEQPDSGENLRVDYLASDGSYKFLVEFPGNGTPGQVVNNVTADRIFLPDDAFHAGFRVRFRLLTASGSDFDYWHVDDFAVSARGAGTSFVSVVNDTAGSPAFSDITNLPEGLEVNDVELSPDTSRLILAAETSAAVTYCQSTALADASFVASLNGATLNCEWSKSAPSSRALGVAAVADGGTFRVYATGQFRGTTVFTTDPLIDGSLTSTDAACGDVYVAGLDGSNGSWLWVTGGDTYDVTDGVPGRAGGSQCDAGVAIDGRDASNLYVTGEITGFAVFGEAQSIESLGDTDAFVGNLSTDGVWFQRSSWTVGVPVPPPPDAKVDDLTFQPDFFIDGEPVDALGGNLFYWAPPITGLDARLIPLQDIENIEIRWRKQGLPLQDDDRTPSQGSVQWPVDPCTDASFADCLQIHVAGSPVEAEPADNSFTFLRIVTPNSRPNDATVNTGLFEATTTGFSSLIYVRGPEPQDTTFEGVVQVVRTVPPAAAQLFEGGVPAEIGQPITDPYHNELGRTGYVLNENAFYDGVGPNAAYDRAGRTGAVIPVNRSLTTRSQDATKELVVSWYRRKAMGVFWPEKPVSYEPFWPLDADLIVVASERGGEAFGQQPLDPLVFENTQVYQQPDVNLPGYNPNDEHAFFAPSSTGTGLQAIFALRSDFGSQLAGDVNAASDPYVLVKYFDSGANAQRFRVYQVLATGAGFNNFRFSGTAATTVAPPYPVSLLPGCAQTNVVGQAATDPQPPPPFFMDYTNQLWSSSAGSGAVRFFYPTQAGFFFDLDNNDENDIDTGDCVPWLARLPEALGGSSNPNDPILVSYDITWPDNPPQLIPGETLLEPKRGLPDIVNQAAVQIAFDEIRDASATPAPANALAQLIDPLNPRTVDLAALPAGIASELNTSGQRIILGNVSGTLKLPASIRQRLSFDPLNGRLSFAGVFDATGAGEPLLLLNVMSFRDRDILLSLDSDSGWQQAVQDLFRLTRNPQGIQQICEASSINESNERVCSAVRSVTDSDVLIGQQDSNGDGILEQFTATGVSPALTAGFSQGSGFLTLAFNNDPGLTPLPVSLQVIRIDCLQSPPPPVDPADADIFSTYQGQIQIISPDNIFDEQLVLRHSGDFGGNPDALEFEWFFQPDLDGTPPFPLPDTDAGQLNGWIQFPVDNPMGAVEISIEGANIQTLSDNWYIARYRGLPNCGNQTEFSIFAGQPGATPLEPRAQLAEGWVKRVVSRLNPFEARVQNFAQAATNNFASMLIQLGERYEGDIALNNDPDNLNGIGLIEAYTTVMRRAISLSSGATPPVDFGPANNAVLLVASRIVDFYTLLGNEAYADAQDPAIGVDVNRPPYFTLAPAIFNFQNQLSSVLEEELVLLRGRDDSGGPVAANPVYNRLFWNFTTGEGEVAYALSYNISDQNNDGVLDEFDARIQFPQGHGDAWGHYLTGLDIYYDLLREPFFTWVPRAEAVTVAGVPITVDFQDERQFAETAAAKARAGAEIVDLTYRSAYVEDPAGQWQGYKDIDPDRAWGLTEWGRRAGQGAYFDWVTATSILQVEEPDPTKQGIQKVDRSTVSELAEIQSHHASIQAQLDEADQGLNPLGLSKGIVPFDIDPSLVDAGETHFEQIYDRASTALDNAVQVWDFSNNLNRMLRFNENEVEDLQVNSAAQELDFNNRLIEIFGYPFVDDIGPGGTYPAGYDGPDLYHYMYVDVNALEGTVFDLSGNNGTPLRPATLNTFNGNYSPMVNGLNYFNISGEADDLGCDATPLEDGCSLGDPADNQLLEVPYTTIDSDIVGFAFTKPPEWTGQRRAPGRLQDALNKLFESRVALDRGLREYENLRRDVADQIDTIEATFDIRREQISIANSERQELRDLTIAAEVLSNAAIAARQVGKIIDGSFKTAATCVPGNFVAGLAAGGDVFSTAECTVQAAGVSATGIADAIGDGLDIASNATSAAKEDVSQQAAIESQVQDARLELFNLKGELDALLRREPLARAEVFSRAQNVLEMQGAYFSTLAEGQRTLQQLINFRKLGAAAVQEYRYEDLAFRIFRNDALQKYRAAFDLAARYVYLAATAYDYETNLLGSDGQAGEGFLTQIVRERSLGQIIGGAPVPGSRGLADPMGRMDANFEVLKGQMGFNNPQTETNRFSLRQELFRIAGDDDEADASWRAILEENRVANLFNLPEFRRFARPFAPESAGPQPGIVIRFPTTVSFSLNYFGNPIGPGDSAYDSSNFATKIRSAGVWFGNYEGLPLSNTPRVYLFPVGADVLRAPAANNFSTREWNIVDQTIPVPFQLGAQDLDSATWVPTDTLIGNSTDIRRFSRFRAFHFGGEFDPSEVITDSRLIGRSVWNREWLLIIPGEALLFDPDEGLDVFINGQLTPGGGGTRDGNGIDDIALFFQTYAYSGN
ncbi:MAG: hypothetical protein AAF358_12935 [Pseudomonadota bacterium]